MSTNKKKFNRKTWEEGFTLIESLAAVVVLGFILLSGGIGLRSLIESIEEIRGENNFFHELLLFEEVLQKQTNRVEFPWFLSQEKLSTVFLLTAIAQEEIIIPFVDGVKDRKLIISVDEEGILLMSREKSNRPLSLHFSKLKGAEAEIIQIDGRSLGIRLSFRWKEEEFSVYGLFGGIALRNGGSDG